MCSSLLVIETFSIFICHITPLFNFIMLCREKLLSLEPKLPSCLLLVALVLDTKKPDYLIASSL